MLTSILTPAGIVSISLAALMGSVIYYDARYYIIPNGINFLILALYIPFFLLMPPEPWWHGLAACMAMLCLGMGMFALGLMGGGDVKLLTALMLWTGFGKTSLLFMLYFSLAGGALALLLLVLRRLIFLCIKRGAISPECPRIFQKNQPIPYGIAIAAAFLYMLATQQVLSLRV